MVIISYPCLPLMDVFTYGTIDIVYQLLLKQNYQDERDEKMAEAEPFEACERSKNEGAA